MSIARGCWRSDNLILVINVGDTHVKETAELGVGGLDATGALDEVLLFGEREGGAGGDAAPGAQALGEDVDLAALGVADEHGGVERLCGAVREERAEGV